MLSEKEQARQYNAGGIVFPTNGAGTNGEPHAKERIWTTTALYSVHKN